jgi:hypothetical protein
MQKKLCDLLRALYFRRGGLQTQAPYIDLILQELEYFCSLID